MLTEEEKFLRKCGYKLITGVGVLFAIVALLFAWVSNSEFMMVDKCLDSGGAWNDTLKTCEYS